MSGFRLVDLAKPFLPLLPEIELPYEQLSFDDKVVYTVGCSFLYLFAQLPVFGAAKSVSDPISFLRPVFGAEKGTLLEFGVFPIISSGLIFQLLAGLKVLKVNLATRADRELFQTLQKLFSIFQYFVLTNIFIATGYFGYNLSLWQIGWINLQLVGAGFTFTLAAEILDKGYGFGSGALTFVTVNVSTNFFASIFGMDSAPTTRGFERSGAIINFITNIRSKPFKNAIIDSFTRSYLPNLTQFYVTAATFAVAIYLQNFRIELPIRSNKVRSVANIYPIRLLYTGALPLAFSYVVLFYLNIIGYTIVNLIFKNEPTQLAVKILGHYTTTGFSTDLVIDKPSVLYFLTPSSGLLSSLLSPLRTLSFFTVILTTSAYFSNAWSLISGSAPKDIANQFKEQGISLSGRRDISISKELQRVIPVAAVSGAAVLATVAQVGEIFGSNGNGAAILIAVGTAYSFLEIIAQEFQQNGSQNFGQLFSGL
jgi:protein transport protein SEC61 subunit alpha